MEEVEDLAQGVWAQASGYGPIIRANGTNVWTQATQPAGAAPQRFFRIIAVPPPAELGGAARLAGPPHTGTPA